MAETNFKRTQPRNISLRGKIVSAPISTESVEKLTVVGGLFEGEIHQLTFNHEGALLVLAGLGVRKFDPNTLAEQDRWLADRRVQSIHACGEKLWVVVANEVYLASFGEPLGKPLAAVDYSFAHTYVAFGTKFVVVTKRGAMIVDTSGTTREYTIDEPWFEGQSSSKTPDRAMLSPSGRSVGVTTNYSGYTVIWDVETGAQLYARKNHESKVLLDDKRLFKGGEYDSSMIDFTTDTWSNVAGSKFFGETFVREGRVLAADSDGGFELLDSQSFKSITQLDSHTHHSGRGTSSVQAALSDTHVATYAAADGVLRVTKIGGETVTSKDWAGSAEGLSLGLGSQRLAVFREWAHGRIECVDLGEQTIVEVRGPCGEDITTAGITADGNKIVAPCGSILRARTVSVSDFNTATCEPIHKLKSCCHEFLNYAEDCYAISTYTLDGSGYVGLYRAGVKRALAKVSYEKEQPWLFAVGHTDDELMVSWRSTTIVYDKTKRPKPVVTITGSSRAVALGPRGFAAYIQGSGKLFVRTPNTSETSLALPERSHHGSDRLAFSRNGELLFVGTADGDLEVRRAESGELLRVIPLHYGPFASLQCAGEALWTMGEDGVIHVIGH